MKLQSNKGASLVIVTIILAVLALLACVLMETAFQNYKISKAAGYMDYSYYAAESAIQKCCDLIKSKCDSYVPDSSITYTGDKEDYSKKVVNQVLKQYVHELNAAGQFKNLTVSGDITDRADIKVSIQYMGYRDSANPDTVLITLGITADSSYVVPGYTSGDKRAFAQKEFEVRLPGNGFKLKGPIYTIGDLFVRNSTVNILGDVHVYGTSPERMSQPEQYYYGGIYARQNALLKIKGNAYSRSFIRTGKYSSEMDNSSIHIYKDAIAQGIQVFGKRDNIVVMRNAYTFDDLEMNGEDSVIAVNGSYFGLSNGEAGRHHDDSSSIINSAVIHHFNSPDSQKSRIVVNGAVMVGGGTWKLDTESGKSLYQIEDASVAWLSGHGAAYKGFPEDNYIDPSDPDDHPTVEEYIDWLKLQNVFGFCNLFQSFAQRNWNAVPAEVSGSIDALVAEIRAAAANGLTNNRPVPGEIKGFSNYAMAANDSIYYMDKSEEYSSDIKKAEALRDSFEIDNLEGEGWSSFWTPYIDSSWSGYYTGVPDALGILKSRLLSIANIFLERNTYANTDPSDPLLVKHTESGDRVFAKLLEALTNLKGTSQYVIDPVAFSADPATPIADPGNLSDPLYPFNAEGNDRYYLIVHDKPDMDLVINGTTFNGIIFTTGRVILMNGAKVNGAIIAAGRGYDADEPDFIAGSAAEVNSEGMAYRAPRVNDEATLSVLDEGGFAAVYISGGSVNVSFPYEQPDDVEIMDADVAREELLNIFKYQDPDDSLDLFSIF